VAVQETFQSAIETIQSNVSVFEAVDPITGQFTDLKVWNGEF
jgi:hypothetical protein